MATQTKNPKKVSLVVRRTISASPERVFDAWLDPKQASRWLFHIPTGTMVKAEIDARVGGRFIFTDRRDGVDFEHVGRYLAIERPKRLAFSFGVPKFSKEETTVTIELAKKGKGCELTLTHEGVLPEWADKSKEGWGKILAALDDSLLQGEAVSELPSDKEIRITRILDAPRDRVWRALSDPKALDQWWGPNGFRNVTKEWDFRPGGMWRHVLIGPDGGEYPNATQFVEIVENDHIVHANAGGKKGEKGISFRMTFSIKALGPSKTEVSIHQVFDTRADRDFVVERFGAIEGGKQTLAKLAEHVRNR